MTVSRVTRSGPQDTPPCNLEGLWPQEFHQDPNCCELGKTHSEALGEREDDSGSVTHCVMLEPRMERAGVEWQLQS